MLELELLLLLELLLEPASYSVVTVACCVVDALADADYETGAGSGSTVSTFVIS